ncbi:hypothetical protein PINS_up008223 [Pythium insidiosum]|nr:hypothetical protein PINS_up008223 [Pythium insidiosum]
MAAPAKGKPSFVMAKAAGRPSHFVDLHTSRSTGVGHLGLPRLSSPVLRTARGAKGDAMPLPRESVVVLIDAVRQSTLPGDDKTRFLFELFDVDHRGVLTRDGVASFIDAMLTNNKVRIFADMDVARHRRPALRAKRRPAQDDVPRVSRRVRWRLRVHGATQQQQQQ